MGQDMFKEIKYICINCKKEYTQKQNFCSECGGIIHEIPPEPLHCCNRCGNGYTNSDKYCANCGKKLFTEKLIDLLVQNRSLIFNLSNEIRLEMIPIPAGSFVKGSPLNELGRWNNENQLTVTIKNPFWIGKFPVTQMVYRAITKTNPSEFIGDFHPVENITWYNANGFCNELNKILADELPEGYEFALPTEEQWEYACRATTTTSLNNGQNITNGTGFCAYLDEIAWYDNSLGSHSTHEVGKKLPNAWGLYDMHGNVWEWCQDDYDGKNRNRICRGGGWNSCAGFCRSAFRRYELMNKYSNNLGFRLALTLKDERENTNKLKLNTVSMEEPWRSGKKYQVDSPYSTMFGAPNKEERENTPPPKLNTVSMEEPCKLAKMELVDNPDSIMFGAPNKKKRENANKTKLNTVSMEEAWKLAKKYQVDNPFSILFGPPNIQTNWIRWIVDNNLDMKPFTNWYDDDGNISKKRPKRDAEGFYPGWATIVLNYNGEVIQTTVSPGGCHELWNVLIEHCR